MNSGECATHFQQILKKYPPQTSSRQTAAGWACFVHNEVNKSKNKPIFDCNKIGDFYDCGCAEDEEEEKTSAEKPEMSRKNREKLADNGRDLNLDHFKPVEISKEGYDIVILAPLSLTDYVHSPVQGG